MTQSGAQAVRGRPLASTHDRSFIAALSTGRWTARTARSFHVRDGAGAAIVRRGRDPSTDRWQHSVRRSWAPHGRRSVVVGWIARFVGTAAQRLRAAGHPLWTVDRSRHATKDRSWPAAIGWRIDRTDRSDRAIGSDRCGRPARRRARAMDLASGATAVIATCLRAAGDVTRHSAPQSSERAPIAQPTGANDRTSRTRERPGSISRHRGVR
jgi:hypothetical protein